MRIGTIASLAASAVLGLGALFLARFWLPSQSAPQMVRGAASAPGVPVVIAAGPIGYGKKLQARDLALTHLPADAVPPGAYASIDQVMKQDAGGAPVALTAISAREPLLPAKLSGAGARPTLAAMIDQGYRAYTIGVTEVAGGGGHVMPGDRVDVVLTRDLTNGASADSHGGSGGKLVSNVVIQNVRVLGMDLNVDPNSVHPAVAHTATLEVDVRDAERLALAGQAGTLSLALRRTGSAEIAQVRPVAAGDLGTSAGVVDPIAGRARRGPARRAAAAPPPPATVQVVDGDKAATVTVPRFGAGV
jgi:pilus assembly protein CpaB